MRRSRQQQQKKERTRLLLFKSLLVAVATVVVVYFMPRFNSFNYTYELNQPWRYGALISAHKFNIMMSDSAQIQRRDSMTSHFVPYYNNDASLHKNVRLALNSLASRNAVEPRITRLFLALIDSIYAHGVISSVQYDSLNSHHTTRIRVINGNTASEVPVSRLFTAKSAYEFISEHLPATDAYREAFGKINFNTVIAINLTPDENKTRTALEEELNALSFSLGFVRANEKIVDRGEIITEEIYQKLKSYEQIVTRPLLQQDQESTSTLSFDGLRNHFQLSTLLGQIFLVLTIMVLLVIYLSVYRKDYLTNRRSSILLFSLVTLFPVIASVMVAHHIFHVFIIPCCMVPIIIRVFLDSRTAFTFHCGMVMLISLTLSQPYEFIIIQIVAGLVAILDLRELTQRSQIIHAALTITLVTIFFYCAYQLATGAEFKDIEYRTLIYFAVNGVLLLFTYPLFWMMEKLFGFVSDVTLVELSNINHPLLRQLSEDAPGTFQHSMQVANLAAEVAKKIDAKVLLVRTGALYHDIGKMDRPVFFTENQAGGNPHKHLSSIKSAEVIIAHVTKGLALADKYDIPKVIRNFISSHHGTGKTQYFLVTYKNEHPDEEVDESLFTYPGPNPQTTEEAILMMSDAVEASSRSLNEYTETNISDLVDRIVDNQVDSGFFRECPITFRDISEAKEVFKNRLTTIYHTRISYPELSQPGSQA